MRIHHLNCGTDCPLGGALFDGRSIGPLGHIVCHCLLIETDAHGLVLRAYQRLMKVDATSRLTNQARLRALSVERRQEVDVTCAHDPVELERFQAGRPL